MLAFHNDPAIKEKYLDRVESHYKMDEIEKGYYWEKGKGCAVGCTIHGNQHIKYEIELGIPKVLAHLEDRIFEGLPNERAKIWPKEFLEAINVGSNLKDVWPKFIIWLLIDEKYGVLPHAKDDEFREVIKLIANYYSKYEEITYVEWKNAASDAANYANYVAYAANAANAADAANAANAYSYARKNHYIAQADKLLELLRESK
jgi:hypothetical protein